MTNTTTETLTVNGVVLNTLAKNVESLAGRLRMPATRTENIKVPGRHGALRVPNKMFEEGLLVLPMWVRGCDDDGKIPGGSSARREFYKRVDELSALFKSGLLDIQHRLPDNSIRQIFGDCMEAIDFTTWSEPLGKFSVSITCHDPFWRDLSADTEDQAADGAAVTIASFNGSTAPVEDMVWEFVGPWTNPGITFLDGSWFQYNDVVASGRSLIVDSGEWEISGTGGLVVDYSKVTHDGADSRWAALPPGDADLTLLGSGRTTATRLKATGHRKFLVG